MTRRDFLASTAAVGLLPAARTRAAALQGPPAGRRRPRILLRSSWQTVNIGDIAHTPGALALLERHAPDADVTLWASPLNAAVRALLRRRFPALRIVEHPADARFDGSDAARALGEADLVLHGSGPSIVGVEALRAARTAGRAYGVYGVTLDTLAPDVQPIVAGARFFYCRDTASLEYLKGLGLPCPVQEFAPDATFALDLRDEAAAGAALAAHRLETGRFVCVVPRLRWTPYPARLELARGGDPVWSARLADNDRYAEIDHAKLREAIVAFVRATGQRVLLCPEMTYQVPLLRPLLYEPLPADVKPAVASLDRYWNVDEAAALYARALAVVSCEMHSPIIALAGGTPAIHVRQPTDTRKGQMWRDVGLGDWLFEVDEASGASIAERLLAIAGHRERARAEAAAAMARVRGRQEASMRVVAEAARAAAGRQGNGVATAPVPPPQKTPSAFQ